MQGDVKFCKCGLVVLELLSPWRTIMWFIAPQVKLRQEQQLKVSKHQNITCVQFFIYCLLPIYCLSLIEPEWKHHLCSALYILPIAYCLWPIAYYQLPIAYYLLATYCLLSQQQNISIWQTTCVQFFKMKPSAKIFFNLFFFLQVRYFTPPQADQPEIFIMAEQEGYGGNYGGDGTKPGKRCWCWC